MNLTINCIREIYRKYYLFIINYNNLFPSICTCVFVKCKIMPKKIYLTLLNLIKFRTKIDLTIALNSRIIVKISCLRYFMRKKR